MFQEIYYEHYRENRNGRYWDEPKKVPYAVRTDGDEGKQRIVGKLHHLGFAAISSLYHGCPVLLINMELKRWLNYQKPCWTSCVKNRIYSQSEFENEVLPAWTMREEERALDEKCRSMVCPTCGSRDVAVYLYGRPSKSVEELQADKPYKITLGGCYMERSNPLWHCMICGCSWGRMDEDPHYRRLFEIAEKAREEREKK